MKEFCFGIKASRTLCVKSQRGMVEGTAPPHHHRATSFWCCVRSGERAATPPSWKTRGENAAISGCLCPVHHCSQCGSLHILIVGREHGSKAEVQQQPGNASGWGQRLQLQWGRTTQPIDASIVGRLLCVASEAPFLRPHSHLRSVARHNVSAR